MIMPKEFIDAINAAVREVDPDYGVLTGGSFTLGDDFDEFVGLEAIDKYGWGPLPPDVQARFEAKWAEKKDEIKKAMVDIEVDIAKKRLAGYDFQKESDEFLARDEAMCEALRNEDSEVGEWLRKKNQGRGVGPVKSSREKVNVRDLVESLKKGELVDDPPLSGLDRSPLL